MEGRKYTDPTVPFSEEIVLTGTGSETIKKDYNSRPYQINGPGICAGFAAANIRLQICVTENFGYPLNSNMTNVTFLEFITFLSLAYN